VEEKTATFTVTVSAPVNAQAPVISIQPQSGTYTVGATVTLSVTAASPDGGTLSYQWHSAVSGGSWTAIEGAVEASYTPSTAAEGAVSYYARVINTNNSLSGTKTASANSELATVTVSPDQSGTGSFSLVWAAEDGSLISNMPENFSISMTAEDTLTLTAAADLTNLQWSINGADLPGPEGTAQSVTIEAVKYTVRDYTLGLYAEKDLGGSPVPCSINITFRVIN
jgi:hypothetical protein